MPWRSGGLPRKAWPRGFVSVGKQQEGPEIHTGGPGGPSAQPFIRHTREGHSGEAPSIIRTQSDPDTQLGGQELGRGKSRSPGAILEG